MIVALLPLVAAAGTTFFVDPTWSGTGDGSAAAPWRTLSESANPDFRRQWDRINGALAGGDVAVVFSARRGDADVPEELTGPVWLDRRDRGPHRLTVDGMSWWNAGASSPVWRPQTGTSRFRIRMTRGCCLSIGWDDDVPRDRVTIRGFEVTGAGARVRWGGSDTVLERMWVHDVSGVGATVQFNAAVTDWPECRELGRSRGVVIRDNVIERGVGEGIYFAGTYTRTEHGGCPGWGPTHADILIERNVIVDPGLHGGEGDGIDLKAGLVGVLVRDNVIRNPRTGAGRADGITCLGRPDGGRTAYVIEGNRIEGAKHGMILGGLNGAVIRRNRLDDSRRVGLYLCADPGRPDRDVLIEDNVVLGAGIGLGEVEGVVLRRNLSAGRGRQITGWNVRGLDSDWNLLVPAGSEFPEGPHTRVEPAVSAEAIEAFGSTAR